MFIVKFLEQKWNLSVFCFSKYENSTEESLSRRTTKEKVPEQDFHKASENLSRRLNELDLVSAVSSLLSWAMLSFSNDSGERISSIWHLNLRTVYWTWSPQKNLSFRCWRELWVSTQEKRSWQRRTDCPSTVTVSWTMAEGHLGEVTILVPVLGWKQI